MREYIVICRWIVNSPDLGLQSSRLKETPPHSHNTSWDQRTSWIKERGNLCKGYQPGNVRSLDIKNDVCTYVTNCFSAHERVILVFIFRIEKQQ